MSATYKVLKIDELTRIAEAGGVEKYYRIQIKTKAGTFLTVDVDEQNFVADQAAKILEAKAISADKIKAL